MPLPCLDVEIESLKGQATTKNGLATINIGLKFPRK